MNVLLKVIAVWGVLDSLWLAFRPASWSRFWGGWLARIGEGGVAPRVLALVELLVGLLILRPRSRWLFSLDSSKASGSRLARRAWHASGEMLLPGLAAEVCLPVCLQWSISWQAWRRFAGVH